MKGPELLERLSAAVRKYVDRRFGELDAVIKALPKPRDGRDGVDGKDAEPVDVSAIIRGVLEQAPIPTHGTNGKDGRDGIDGKDGKDGRDGVDGRTPTREEIKALIPEPVAGKDGTNGRDGKDGTDGRDGLDISPLPLIDETRSYPRGTYATHKGGLWRSFEQTSGMKGWECIVNGFNGFEEEQIDERTFVVRCFTSTGVIEKTRKVASMVYRQLWVAAKDYEQGDCVTWGGSMWVAIPHDGQYKQPGTEGSGWRLAVRAGRDGDRS